MARNRTTTDEPAVEFSDSPENTETAAGMDSTVEAPKDTDRGNIGVVTVERDTEEWDAFRTRASNNPVAIAVHNAVMGESYAIAVENDEKKIERVRRMLRAAAQREDVGLHIHPRLTTEIDPGTGEPTGRVKVRFKTGEREKRVVKTPEVAPAPAE